MTGTTRKDPFTAVTDGVRHAVYAAYAEAGPVHRITLPTGVEGWLVTRYDEARALLADPRLSKGGPGDHPFSHELPPDVMAALVQHLLNTDPPDHTRLRRLVSAAFTRRRSELLAPRIQTITDALLDQMEAAHPEIGDEAELITEFAHPLPLTVICELLRIPEQHGPQLRAWTGTLVAGVLAGVAAYSAAAAALAQFLRELLDRKRAEPADDLLSALIAVRDGGDRLTEDELTSMVFLLVLAGHETTVNLIGNGTRALLTHPGQLALIRAEPHRIDAAVEELLRYDGPVQTAMPLFTTAPVPVGDVVVPAGEVVIVSLLAANRDPTRHPDADRLDLDRPSVAHLAFGHGIHHCLGAPLARIEGRIALSSLITRFPGLRPAVPVEDLVRTPGLLMNGLAALPVQLR